MAYNSQIPLSTDKLSVSQGQILGNFQALGAIAGNGAANSSSLNTAVGFNFVNFALPPIAATTSANQMALYTGNFGVPAKQELFSVRQNTTSPIPMTASNTNLTQGWSYLPSGALMIWGRSRVLGGPATVVTYNNSASGGIDTFPGFTINSSVTITQGVQNSAPANPIWINAYTPTGNLGGFSAQSATSFNFFWMAIGI